MTTSTLQPLRPLNPAQDVNEGDQVLEQFSGGTIGTQQDPIPFPVSQDQVLSDGMPVRVKEDPLHSAGVVDEAHDHLLDPNTNDVARTDEAAHEYAPEDEEWNRHIEEEWRRRKTYTPAQCLQNNLNSLSNILSGADFARRDEAMQIIIGLQSLAGTYRREEEYLLSRRAKDSNA